MNWRLVQALVSAERTQQTMIQKATVHHLCAVLGFDYLTLPVFVRGDATWHRCLRVYICLMDALLSSAAVFHISFSLKRCILSNALKQNKLHNIRQCTDYRGSAV